MNWRRKIKKVPPYSRLAPVYDHLMQHVDYFEWAAYVDEIFKTFGTSVNSVLDVSCGTGNFLLALNRKGYQVKGFDFSLSMLLVARKKTEQRGLNIPLWCGDMLQFSVSEPQDAIVCLYDSINYLMSLAACQKFYEICFQNLVPGGLLIFDICTEWNSVVNFHNYQDQERTDFAHVLRRSFYDQKKRIHYNDFKLMFKNDPLIYRECHQQQIYYINEIRDSIPTRQFELMAIHSGFTRDEGSENVERVHFILKKR